MSRYYEDFTGLLRQMGSYFRSWHSFYRMFSYLLTKIYWYFPYDKNCLKFKRFQREKKTGACFMCTARLGMTHQLFSIVCLLVEGSLQEWGLSKLYQRVIATMGCCVTCKRISI